MNLKQIILSICTGSGFDRMASAWPPFRLHLSTTDLIARFNYIVHTSNVPIPHEYIWILLQFMNWYKDLLACVRDDRGL